ncbi:phosphotriesterase-related protein-like [Littorina saxatilis]|uniref:Parathion hydrolase-related protein n=1 Tax=Littorina saxatilis TaxID=31220 RepID=A0AAN9GAC0_9CAEN
MASRKGKIQTVCGLIEPKHLGPTLTHEHLMLQADCFYVPPSMDSDQDKTNMPFVMENLGWIRQNPYSYKPNLNLLHEEDAIVEEIKAYKNLGGQAIVENSTIGLSRDVQFLQRLSHTTGVHIVAGTGFYVDSFQTESTRQSSEEALAARIRDDICGGADGTEICCGVIGEIGCAWPLSDFEKRSLRSAAAVQSELGSPTIIHPGRNPKAPAEIMRIFLEAGAQANKTVMSHLDRTFADAEQLLEFAKLGCYCEYDLFGIETSHYQLWQEADMPSDAQRIIFIKNLLDNGYRDKILVAHDIHTKHRLKKYGGHGFTHILENIVPKMKQRSISDEDIKHILTDNPATWLTFTK